MELRKAIYWTIFWVSLSALINIFIYFLYGYQPAIEYLTGYVIEESLSIDNLFVFLYIFSVFGIEPAKQRRVLNWGIFGAIILRGIFIFAGTKLVTEFSWILYIFGGMLIYSGFYMLFGKEKKINPERNPVIKFFKKFFKIKTDYEGKKFFIKEGNILYATPLFIVLLAVETTDVIFAIDSIPAIFSITQDPLIVFLSNLMAVLGLRSLYFVLEHIQKVFVYVKYGVGVVLIFVGCKMLIVDILHVDTFVSLFIVVTLLTGSVLASFIKPMKILK